MVKDSLNPEFVTEIMVDYLFEEQQNMILEVYDADDMNELANLSKQDFIGYYDFKLGSIVSSRN